MADHLQTEKSMLARGLKAFNDKVIWMAVVQGMELYLHYAITRAHSAMDLLNKNIHTHRMSAHS